MDRTPRRAATLAAALLAFTLPAVAQEQPVERPTGTIHVDGGDVAASEVLRRWAEAQGKVVQIDPQITAIRMTFAAPAELDALSLQHVLDFHDIVLVERDGVFEAHHRRNVSQKVGPPWDYVEGLAPRNDRLVTCVVPIEHGGGNAIFATVRGLLTRDTNRIGNILYVQGPEVIILVDLARNVRYYQEVIAALDRPPPLASARVRLTVYEVDRAWWTKLRGERPATQAQADALRAGGDAVKLVGDVDLQGGQPFAFERAVEVDGQSVRLTLQVGAAARAVPGKDGEIVMVPAFEASHQLHLRLDVTGSDRAPLRLTAHTAFAAIGGAPSVQTFSGRAGAAPTDVVLVAARR